MNILYFDVEHGSQTLGSKETIQKEEDKKIETKYDLSQDMKILENILTECSSESCVRDF